jgi:hypothetical protein
MTFRTGEAAEFSPREVIMLFAHAIAKLGALTQSVGGTIGFSVSGDRGGRWIVDLDRPGGAWSEWTSARVEPSTIVETGEEAFASLINGEASPPRADAFSVRGDRSKLRGLARLMEVGGTIVAQRARDRKKQRKEAKRGGTRR